MDYKLVEHKILCVAAFQCTERARAGSGEELGEVWVGSGETTESLEMCV